eukprot:3183867-Amphidinium_carterae.1
MTYPCAGRLCDIIDIIDEGGLSRAGCASHSVALQLLLSMLNLSIRSPHVRLPKTFVVGSCNASCLRQDDYPPLKNISKFKPGRLQLPPIKTYTNMCNISA